MLERPKILMLYENQTATTLFSHSFPGWSRTRAAAAAKDSAVVHEMHVLHHRCIFETTQTFHSEKPSGAECCANMKVALWIFEHHLTCCCSWSFHFQTGFQNKTSDLEKHTVDHNNKSRGQIGYRFLISPFLSDRPRGCWMNYTENLTRLLLRLRFKCNTSLCSCPVETFQSISVGYSQVMHHTEMQTPKVKRRAKIHHYKSCYSWATK